MQSQPNFKMAKKKDIESNWWSNMRHLFEYIGAILVVGGIGYAIAVFQCSVQHKMEIMEIRQEYNVQISNIKLAYNNRILELQSQIKIYELQPQAKSHEK